MLALLNSALAIGPLGTWEMLIIAFLVLCLGTATVGGIVFLVIYLSKKK